MLPAARLIRIASWAAVLLFGVGLPALAQERPAAESTPPTDSLWQLEMAQVVVTATRAERQAGNGRRAGLGD
jgi:hypothetical protein